MDISKLGLFVSTAHAVQTKISRLTTNSLHPPQNLGLHKCFGLVGLVGCCFVGLIFFVVGTVLADYCGSNIFEPH
ncbi:hypothetical protein [Companilactobacillus zhongbaensis]|uniref:hypothetical protein n=1 Tax=Companilactobacillus zhongbaensis TaxID=2486009 RepID=UPI000F76ED88|nr:hypothetical protein [Companilactobacillus zhongbaensis]